MNEWGAGLPARGQQASGRHTWRTLTLSVVAVAVIALGGCGGSSGSSGPSKSAFCSDTKKLDSATATANNLSDLLKDLKKDQSTLANTVKNAPAAIKSQAEVLVNASEKAIKSGDTSGFNQQFENAGTAVDKYCGGS